jgi:zinc-ribbon family
MFIIWGFRSFVTTLTTVFARCGKCGNPAAQRLSLVKRKFTIFFIPVFTLKKTYVMTCAMCGASFKITAEDAERLQAGAAAAAQHEAGPGSAPEMGVPEFPAPPSAVESN